MAAFNFWAWIDSFKYQVLTLQNQKVANEKEIFSKNFGFYDQGTVYRLNLLWQARWFVTDHHQGHNWSVKKEKDQDRILTHSRINGILRR